MQPGKTSDNLVSADQCSVSKMSELSADIQFPEGLEQNLSAFIRDVKPSLFLRAKKIVRCGYTMYSKLCSKVKKRNSYTFTISSAVEDYDIGSMFETEYFLVHKETMHVFAVGKRLKGVGGVFPGNAVQIQRVQYSR